MIATINHYLLAIAAASYGLHDRQMPSSVEPVLSSSCFTPFATYRPRLRWCSVARTAAHRLIGSVRPIRWHRNCSFDSVPSCHEGNRHEAGLLQPTMSHPSLC
jgi:hypothetical protein